MQELKPQLRVWVLIIEQEGQFESARPFLNEKAVRDAVQDRLEMMSISKGRMDKLMSEYDEAGDNWFGPADLNFTVDLFYFDQE